MKKKIIPILIILLVLIIGTGVIYFKSNKSNFKETKTDEVIKTSEKTNEDITAKTEEIDVKEKEDKKDETVPPKEEKQETKKESQKSSSKETSTNNTPSQTPQNNTQQSTQQNNVVVEQPQAPEPVKQSGPWEAWGMTEDQYYNQPMHSWERVDFSSMNECLNYGDNYAPYLNGEVLYNCREITSASGKFLGVMFDTEKLNY